MRRRILALALAWCMALSIVESAVLAAEKTRPVTVTICTGVQETPAAEIAVEWDDAWFAQDAARYCHGLAVASMALSGAAYNREYIGSALEKLGFSDVRLCHYSGRLAEADNDTAAYAFALKRIPDAGGNTVPLVAVVVRGTEEAMEWYSNLNLGSGGGHAGFSAARDDLLVQLEIYLADRSIGDGPVDFLVTGHSRGAAVANLTAASLTDARTGDHVYGYTFASPAVSTDAAKSGYENIFNIVNSEDIVTMVPLEAWGFRRYGVDLALPGASDGDRFAKMRLRYTSLTGQSYAAFQNPETVRTVLGVIARVIPDVSDPRLAELNALLGRRTDELTDFVRQNGLAALLLGGAVRLIRSEIASLAEEEGGGIASAHCMAGYYSWLTACETAEEAERMLHIDE